MIYKTHGLNSVYKNIKKQTLKHNSTISIFCARDFDSICTTKLLTNLFSKDQLRYKICPVESYAELDQRIEELKEVDNLGFVFLVNCGARAEVSKFWFFDEVEVADRQNENKEDMFGVIILDNQRPINHRNFAQNRNIFIIDDGSLDPKSVPTEKEIAQYEADLKEGEPDENEGAETGRARNKGAESEEEEFFRDEEDEDGEEQLERQLGRKRQLRKAVKREREA